MSGFNYAEKIRKLMAVANSPGATADEASTAAAMAAQLALQYNIDMGKISEQDAAPAKVFERGAPAMAIFGGDRQAALYMAGGVAALYGCSVLVSKHPAPSNKSDIFFVGQKHNIALCSTWLDYLWQSCERGNREDPMIKQLKGKPRYVADRSFRLSFGSSVATRLYEKLQAMKSQGIKDAESTSSALVVSNWYETEKREVQKWMADNMRLSNVTSKKNRNLDRTAALAGHKAGKNVGLHDQLGNR